MGRVVMDYVSDHTKWMNEQLAQHPEWVADQKKGRAIWWDVCRTQEELKAAAESKVPNKPYTYDVNFVQRED